MSSPNPAWRARRPAPRSLVSPLGLALSLSIAIGCEIDDRALQSGPLALSRLDAAAPDAGELDAGAPDAALGTPPPGVPPPSPGAPAEPRPIRALGEAASTALVGGSTGKDDRARCVEGVLVGFHYAFNDDAAESFPARLTFVAPICATPRVVDGALALDEPASLAWTVIGDDGAALTRPVPTRALRCPEDYAVIGLTGSIDEIDPERQLFAVRELELDCAPLRVEDPRVAVIRGPVASVAAERFAPPGALEVEVACGSGTTAATGAIVRWGSWLDGVGLQCSRLSWPRSGGQGCALDEDCQSGVCEPFATCAPGSAS